MSLVTVPSVTINARWNGVNCAILISLDIAGLSACATNIFFTCVSIKVVELKIVSVCIELLSSCIYSRCVTQVNFIHIKTKKVLKHCMCDSNQLF